MHVCGCVCLLQKYSLTLSTWLRTEPGKRVEWFVDLCFTRCMTWYLLESQVLDFPMGTWLLFAPLFCCWYVYTPAAVLGETLEARFSYFIARAPYMTGFGLLPAAVVVSAYYEVYHNLQYCIPLVCYFMVQHYIVKTPVVPLSVSDASTDVLFDVQQQQQQQQQIQQQVQQQAQQTDKRWTATAF